MMNKDFRILITFPGHPKTEFLYERLGAEGIKSLVFLWAYAAANKSDGYLTNMSIETIAKAAKWPSERPAEELVRTLLDPKIGYLEYVEDRTADGDSRKVLYLHDWPEHNPYAARSMERSELARKRAEKRWKKTDEEDGCEHGKKGKDNKFNNLMLIDADIKTGSCTLYAQGMKHLCTVHKDHSNPECTLQSCPFFLYADAPSPSPSPSPLPNINIDDEFKKLWKRYPSKDGLKKALVYFKSSVKTVQDLADIDTAMDKYRHHLKKNDWKRPMSGKTWFNNWRDWINWEEPPGPLTPREKEQREKLEQQLRNTLRELEMKRKFLAENEEMKEHPSYKSEEKTIPQLKKEIERLRGLLDGRA